jgi:hypothetical protein
MQKLFENWREFRKQTLNEITGQDTTSDMAALAGLGSKTAAAELDYRLNDPRYREEQEAVTAIFSVFDPSGITGWPFLKEAYDEFKKKPTAASSGLILLAFVGVLPAGGGVARAGRAAKGATRIKKINTLSGKTVSNIGAYRPVINQAKIVAKQSLVGRALKEAFESGVITSTEFFNWYKKSIDPNASRQQLGLAWQTVNNYVGKVETPDPFTFYRAVDGQFKNIIKKFNVGVDDSIEKGGWMVSLASTAPKVWNKYLQNINKIDSIPVTSVGVAVGAKTATKGGKELMRTLMHEIGHVQLLKNFPKIGAAFLEEYRNLILKRISEMRQGLQQADLDDAEELLNAAKAAISGADKNAIDAVVDQIKVYEKSEIKSILRGIQVLVLEESARGLNFAAKQGGDIRKAMFAGPKQYNYSLFTDAMKEINSRLGIRTNKFYFLQMEEVFAELFEKSVRKVAGGGSAASKNFPNTSMSIEKIINKEIIPKLKESLLRENKYKMSISIKKTTI